MLIKIQRSMKERQPIEMIYMNGRLECSKRKVMVKKIEKGYIMAYCLVRNDIRRFRIQDILAVSYPPSKLP